MDEEKAAREVTKNLRTVIDAMRRRPGKDMEAAADNLEKILASFESLTVGREIGHAAGNADTQLVDDTLLMLDAFRRIKRPALRGAIISIVQSVHNPDKDEEVVD